MKLRLFKHGGIFKLYLNFIRKYRLKMHHGAGGHVDQGEGGVHHVGTMLQKIIRMT